MISAADREPPGCPLPAVAIIVITWRRSFLANSVSSLVDRVNLFLFSGKVDGMGVEVVWIFKLFFSRVKLAPFAIWIIRQLVG